MTWGAVGSAAVGAGAGILAGGDGDKDPWDPHDFVPGHLQGIWNQYGQEIGNLQNPEYYQGQLVADQNPWLQDSLSGMGSWGAPGGVGDQMMNTMWQGGQQGLQAMGSGMDILDKGFQYDQGVFDQTMGNLMPGLQGSFDAAARDINRDLNWNTLPGLDMALAGSGQQGSTKHGQQSALAQGMAQDRASDVGASMYQNALNQANQNAMRSGGANFSSASQYGDLARMGSGMMGSAFDMGIGGLGLMNTAGRDQFGYDQSLINADKARWDFEQNVPWTSLNDRLNMINGQKVSGVGPSSVQTANPYQSAWQGAQAGLGIYDMFGGGQSDGWSDATLFGGGGGPGAVWNGDYNDDFAFGDGWDQNW